MNKFLMGIDRGTTNVKVAVYDLEGREIKISSRTCEKVQSLRPGFAEQDMEQMWRDTAAAIHGIWDKFIRPENIVGIGLSGQGGGLFLVDKEGQPVRKGIVSLDTRVNEAAKIWEAEGGHEKFLELWGYGNPTVPEALLYWLKIYEQKNYKKISWVLQCKDWIRFRLTGKAFYDTTDASNGFLIDSDLKYKMDDLDEFDLGEMRTKFPELLNPWELAGTVTAKAAEETGLLEGTPIAAGGHDVAMVALGAGCYRKGQLATVLGTFGLNLLVIEKPHMMMQHYSKIVLSGSKDCYLMMNGGNTGAATEWFINTFCKEEIREAEKAGKNIFLVLEEEVLSAPDEAKSNVVCHPFTEPPFSIAGYKNAKFGFYNIVSATTKPQLIRAFYEGIAIEMAMSLEVSRKAVNNLESMRLIGGGAASRMWGQMFADACGIKVEIMDLKEAGCRGAALSAAIAVGIYKNHTSVENLPNSIKKVYEPLDDSVKYMQKKMADFKEIGRTLYNIWR